MAQPMFIYAGVYDSVDEAKEMGALLDQGRRALVVVGIDWEAERSRRP
jgi:hypothetical protein